MTREQPCCFLGKLFLGSRKFFFRPELPVSVFFGGTVKNTGRLRRMLPVVFREPFGVVFRLSRVVWYVQHLFVYSMLAVPRTRWLKLKKLPTSYPVPDPLPAHTHEHSPTPLVDGLLPFPPNPFLPVSVRFNQLHSRQFCDHLPQTPSFSIRSTNSEPLSTNP